MTSNVCRQCGTMFKLSLKSCPNCNASTVWKSGDSYTPPYTRMEVSQTKQMLDEAIALHNHVKYKEAISLYEQVIKSDPDSAWAESAFKQIALILNKRPDLSGCVSVKQETVTLRQISNNHKSYTVQEPRSAPRKSSTSQASFSETVGFFGIMLCFIAFGLSITMPHIGIPFAGLLYMFGRTLNGWK